MSRVRKLAVFSLSLATGLPAFAAESNGIEPMAGPLFHLGPLPVTNSMVTGWVVAVALIVIIRIAIGKLSLSPSRGQVVVESLVEGVLDLISPIVGSKVAKAAFPLLVGLFTFILIQNWSGLLPGVGTVMMRNHSTGRWMEFVRPAHADMNGTLALAAVATAGWLYFCLRYAGPRAILIDLFGNKSERSEVNFILYLFLYVIFFCVGLIEVISIMFRPVSLSFRLYGNIFGGENLLHAMSGICKWGLPIPFYFLEMLIGLVQALVFTLLVAVYIGLLCNHGDGHEEHGHTAGAGTTHS